MGVPLRRHDKEIKEQTRIQALLKAGKVLHLAMVLPDGSPYMATLNYGPGPEGVLYLHSARQGRKLEALAANPQVCFTVAPRWVMVPGDNPCNWTCAYQSLVGFGSATLVEDEDERRVGLAAVAAHCSGDPAMRPPAEGMGAVTVIRIDITSLTGKESRADALPGALV